MITSAIFTLLALFVSRRVWVLIQADRMDRRVPMHLTFIEPLSLLGVLLPMTKWNLGLGFIWRDRKTLYQNNPLRTTNVTPLFHGTPLIYSGNVATLRQVLANNSPFFKPAGAMEVLQFMGTNVVASEGEDWRRHRRITAPAFNQTTYQNVWVTTANVYHDMLEKEGWKDLDEVVIPDVRVVTHKLALFIIATVGFGIPMSWDSPDRDDSGRLSVQAVVFRVAGNILARALTPGWAYNLGIPKLREVDEAFRQFEEFLIERISTRERELTRARAMEEGGVDISDKIRDVFGRLVNVRLTEGKLALTDQEIIGNCFIFVFAGHETTALTLSATLALLGLYPESQEWVYNSIRDVLGDREPTFDDYDALEDVLACFYEALRLFRSDGHRPEAPTHTDNPENVENISIKAGSNLIMDMIGMFNDPFAFPDPEAFKPWRWTKTAKFPSDAPSTKRTLAEEESASNAASSMEGFIGFSFGPRTCLGHKFAKIEAVAFLTFLLCDWKIEPVMRDGETKEEWRARVLNPRFALQLTFGDVPLRLVKRK